MSRDTTRDCRVGGNWGRRRPLRLSGRRVARRAGATSLGHRQTGAAEDKRKDWGWSLLAAASALVAATTAAVLLGFWQLLIRGSAITQLVGFLMLDNGIAAISSLTSGGLPLVVELGATLDVLLVVLILGALVVRMQAEEGHIDISELRELHD